MHDRIRKKQEPKKILIIDDDADLSFIISEMLKNYGYEVTTAENGEQAFTLLAGNVFHLILLDINLPDMTGLELCRELRRVSQIPIIFASARTSESDRITGFDIGGDDYLPKPYSMKELLSRVNALMRRTYNFREQEKITTLLLVAILKMVGLTQLENGVTLAVFLIPAVLLAMSFLLFSYIVSGKIKSVEVRELISE